ncbi:MAG: hypothetical protein Q7U78_11355 [Gallionella sp.]|nr:hypothetical protein [Gallionella sp.]
MADTLGLKVTFLNSVFLFAGVVAFGMGFVRWQANAVMGDVVEAMASHRPYRPGLGIAPALEEPSRGSGTHYDPQVVAACLTLFREKHYVFPG